MEILITFTQVAHSSNKKPIGGNHENTVAKKRNRY
jgi:hypothetical protein